VRLDIGCGDRGRPEVEYMHLDAYDFSAAYPEEAFMQHNVKDPLPFEDGSIEEIWCNHMLEHLPPRHPEKDIDFLVWVMNEFHRVLKVGGKAHCIVPWCEHANNRRSPGHYRSFDVFSFQWWTYTVESMPGEIVANQRNGRWGCEKNTVHENTHIYAIMVKLEAYP